MAESVRIEFPEAPYQGWLEPVWTKTTVSQAWIEENLDNATIFL